MYLVLELKDDAELYMEPEGGPQGGYVKISIRNKQGDTVASGSMPRRTLRRALTLLDS